MLKFSHVMLYVGDVDRAAKWYAQHMGFVSRYMAAPHYAVLWHEPMQFRLDLHPDPSGMQIGKGPTPYFVADDLNAEIAKLRSRGIKVEDPRNEGDSPRFSEFKDSEGNTIGLCE